MRSARPTPIAEATTALALVLGASVARAAEPASFARDAPSERAADHLFLVARSETDLRLFRRALLPGANGTLVTTETAAPIHEYLTIQAGNIDLPWQRDGLELEFSAWGRVWPTQSELEPPFDGDVQSANLRWAAGPVWLRLGRQQVAGGAARFARFDGAMVGAQHPLGLFVDVYAGYSVLPRWDARPGYHHLGSGEGERFRYPDEDAARGDHWLTGAHLGLQLRRARAALSVHEQRATGGVERRNVALDVSAEPDQRSLLGASALVELDSRRLATLRAFADFAPHPALELDAEYLRAEPALLLSRLSVLSVFTSDGYDELGGGASFRPLRWLRVDARGHVQLHAAGDLGSRGEIATRLTSGDRERTTARLAYARVDTPENGYHSLRASLGRRLLARLGATLEAYGYFYDEPISGYRSSSVYSGTLSYQALRDLELMWGGSLSRSPYAALDAQTLLRVSYRVDAGGGAFR